MTARVHALAPEFALPDLEGRLHRLADYRGQIVVVNFWSAECPWSERTDWELIPALEAWNAGMPTPRVVLLPVAPNANEPPEMLAAVARKRGLPLVLHDAHRKVAGMYGVHTTPHLFVVDAEGILRYHGAFDDVTFRQRTPTQHYLKDAVDALLRGDAPDPSDTPAYGCAVVEYSD